MSRNIKYRSLSELVTSRLTLSNFIGRHTPSDENYNYVVKRSSDKVLTRLSEPIRLPKIDQKKRSRFNITKTKKVKSVSQFEFVFYWDFKF